MILVRFLLNAARLRNFSWPIIRSFAMGLELVAAVRSALATVSERTWSPAHAQIGGESTSRRGNDRQCGAVGLFTNQIPQSFLKPNRKGTGGPERQRKERTR